MIPTAVSRALKIEMDRFALKDVLVAAPGTRPVSSPEGFEAMFSARVIADPFFELFVGKKDFPVRGSDMHDPVKDVDHGFIFRLAFLEGLGRLTLEEDPALEFQVGFF
jgi:hypothetical protein